MTSHETARRPLKNPGTIAGTHYDVLGVKDTASVRDIKDAFRRLALMWHPDRCKVRVHQDAYASLRAATQLPGRDPVVW